MGDKLLPFRREHLGTAAGDRLQRPAQQASQKINAIIGRSMLVAAGFATLTANQTTASATMVDIPGLSLSVTAQNGDVLVIDSSLYAFITAGVGSGFAQLVIVEGTAASPLVHTIGSQGVAQNTLAVTTTMTGLWTVQQPGAVTVKVQALTTGGATLTIYGNAATTSIRSNLRVQQHRKVG